MPHFKPSDKADYQIHYEVFPKSLPRSAMFIHGNLASNGWWGPSREVWRKKSKDQNWAGTMVLVEMRGCGQSHPPKTSADVDMKKFAEDFISLAAALKLGPMGLVGHSTGGLVAALMMALKPDLFFGQVLLDPVGPGGVKLDDTVIAAFQKMKADRVLTGAVIGGTIHKNNPNTPFFNDVIVKDAFQAVQTVGPWILEALKNVDYRALLKGVKKPSLVLHGEHDAVLPMGDSMELALLMGGEFSVLKGCGHCANVENPELFVQKVHEFLFESTGAS